VFSKKELINVVNEKIWERKWSYLNDTPPALKEYYRKNMNEFMTIENIEAHW
jgi:hypothetical protein